MSTVDTIKDRLSITEVVGAYVKLTKAGANLRGLCPFHQEKTPSFMVSPTRNSFYCFGCGAKGDIFSFVEQFEGVDFMGALKVLADRAGVEIEKQAPEAKNERERLFKIMDTACLFYHKGLSEAPEAKEYLKKRGVEVPTIRTWRLGYARPEWRELYNYLLSRKFTAGEMLKAGLVKPADNGYYDTFRSRIVFPIANSAGRVVAFSGRIFPVEDNVAKYLNSPETTLFNKSSVLYGYDRAKFEIRTKKVAILVEGQMDLILSHQIGLTNVVATSGTAFTDLHAGLIKRFAEKLIICYDGDKAGISAALRAAVVALRCGLDVRIARLPDEKDPADMAIADKAAYTEALEKAEHVIDFALGVAMQTTTDQRELGKLIVANVLPYVQVLESAVEQAHFIGKIAGRSHVREEALRQEFKKLPPPNTVVTDKKNTTIALARPIREQVVARQLFGIMFLLEQMPAEQAPKFEKLHQELLRIEGEEGLKSLTDRFTKEKEVLLFEAEKSYQNTDFLDFDIKELLKRLEVESLERAYAEAADALAIAERERDDKKRVELIAVCNQISKKLSILK